MIRRMPGPTAAPRGDGRATTDAPPIRGLTLDAMGCLVTLQDPTLALTRLLESVGIDRPAAQIAGALRVEIAHYKAHHLESRTPEALRRLQRTCAGIVVRELGEDPDAVVDESFVDGFLGCLRFELIDGVADALAALDAAGIPMVCVSNWDATLPDHLERLGLTRYLRGTICSGVVGVAKPDPGIFAPALELLDLPATAVGHLGDEAVDRDGAAAAGLRYFEPPIRTLPERLGVGRGAPGRIV